MRRGFSLSREKVVARGQTIRIDVTNLKFLESLYNNYIYNDKKGTVLPFHLYTLPLDALRELFLEIPFCAHQIELFLSSQML